MDDREHKIDGDNFWPPQEFHKVLERERAKADRTGHVFSLVRFEVGPARTSSATLAKLTQILPCQARISDEIGWLGVDCLAVLLFNTTGPGAERFIQKIKAALGHGTPLPPCDILIYPIYGTPPGSKNRPDTAQEKEIPPQDLHKAAESLSPPVSPRAVGHARYEDAHLFRRRLPFWKRTMDIVLSLLGLIFFFPMFVVFSVFIKIVSPGPVFFKQKRVGFGGTPFIFWKFRTMEVNADPRAHQQHLSYLIHEDDHPNQPMTKLDNDPRIIPLGRILRKSCLDELPQLINVLRGEMSLVGPRPPIPYEVQEYSPWHWGRFDALPGMTGLWQVSGKNRLSFKEMVRLDIRYARQLSFLLDMKILLLTPNAILIQMKESL